MLLCFVIMAAETIDYSSGKPWEEHVMGGFSSHEAVLNGRNMQEEARVHERDLNALLAFKKAITYDPSGSLSNWTAQNSHNICSWYGVRCRPHSTRVVQIDLSSSGLEGILSSSLGSLSLLKTMNLSGNNFTGGIPPEFGRLKALRILDLSGNWMLGGSVPKSLLNCTHLKWIGLGDINLRGTIPTEFGRLVELEHLDLSWNALGGSIPTSLGNCTSLSHLDLSRTH
jgi:Leucine-rich repeat (LRR) protein